MQWVELKVPAVLANLTVPVGVLDGAGEVSVTVAEHGFAWPIITGDAHETVVAVLRLLTVTVDVPELVA